MRSRSFEERDGTEDDCPVNWQQIKLLIFCPYDLVAVGLLFWL
jgi:hypothetical protein